MLKADTNPRKTLTILAATLVTLFPDDNDDDHVVSPMF